MPVPKYTREQYVLAARLRKAEYTWAEILEEMGIQDERKPHASLFATSVRHYIQRGRKFKGEEMQERMDKFAELIEQGYTKAGAMRALGIKGNNYATLKRWGFDEEMFEELGYKHPNKPKDAKHKCPECDMRLHNRGLLKQHYRAKHMRKGAQGPLPVTSLQERS